MKCSIAFAALYIAAGFVTFAAIYEGTEKCSNKEFCHDDVGLGSVVGGAAWPIYWGGVGALAAVRAVKSYSSAAITMCKDSRGNAWRPIDGVCIMQDARPLYIVPNGTTGPIQIPNQ